MTGCCRDITVENIGRAGLDLPSRSPEIYKNVKNDEMETFFISFVR